jgi:transcriptional regulator with XRE-family HTH domain
VSDIVSADVTGTRDIVSSVYIAPAEVVEIKGRIGLRDICARPMLSAVSRVSLGQQLKEYRLANPGKNGKPMTQTELARRMGVKQSRISDLEKERYATQDLKSLFVAARVMRKPIDEIVVGFDPEYDAMLRDLVRHASSGKTPSLSTSSAVSHGAPQAQIGSLERRIAELEEVVRSQEVFINELLAVAKRGEQVVGRADRTTTKSQAKRRRRH